MIDWLKYFPLHLRDAEEDAAIKGPAFSSARPVTLMPGGNIIRLRAPRHRTDVQERQIYFKGYDVWTTGLTYVAARPTTGSIGRCFSACVPTGPLKWPINVDEIENPPMSESMVSQKEGSESAPRNVRTPFGTPL
jgi:hypothetical protein